MITTDHAALARGRWEYLLPQLGIDRRFLVNKHGPCPLCEGTDRFRYDDKDGDGRWFCNHCGGGNGFTLLMKRYNWSFRTAADEVEKAVVGAPPPKQAQAQVSDEGWQRRRRNEYWSAGASAPPRGYLARRSPGAPASAELRWHPRLAYAHADGRKSYHPALLARVRDQGGKPVNIHRTYLSDDGLRKADVPEAKRMMPGSVPLGSAIRLTQTAEEMGIAEGLETALSCYAMFGVPTWAAIDAHHLEHWEPPPVCKLLHIYGDHDGPPYYTGEFVAYSLAHRLVMRPDIRVLVHLPPEPKTDWNDVHQARLTA